MTRKVKRVRVEGRVRRNADLAAIRTASFMICNQFLGGDCVMNNDEKTLCTVENCRVMKTVSEAIEKLKTPNA